MLLDVQTMYSDAQAIKTSAASTNIVKLASNQYKMTEIAFGNPIPLLVQLVEDIAGATSLKVAFQTSATEDFADPVTLAEATENDAEKLVAGYKFALNYIPKGNLGYTRLFYTVGGTATAGAITAGIVLAHDNSYQDM